jgi:hypothetical protein
MRKRERKAWGDEIVEASVWDEDGEWDRTSCDNCKTLTPIIFQLSKNTTKTNRSRDWNMSFFFSFQKDETFKNWEKIEKFRITPRKENKIQKN